MTSRALAVALAACVLVASGAGGVIAQDGAGPVDSTPSVASSHSPDSYVLEQGGVCQPIEPLSTDGTVEEFYDYRSHETHPPDVDRLYSSYGTTHLQEDDTSILFLHEGTDGLSLVMVHGQLEGDGDGGLVTFEIDGLPEGADWVVRDDDYGGEDSETNVDEFDSGPGWASASWVWRDARTDGGAINGGLDGEFALTIHPAFNDDAEFADDADDLIEDGVYDNGTIDDWEVLSGETADPERTALSLEEPVTIRTGGCGDTSISYDRTDDGMVAHVENAEIGEPLTVASGTSADGVAFGDLEVVPTSETATVEFEAGQPNTLLESPENAESLSSLELSGEGFQAGSTVTFTVEKDVLEAHDFEPEDVRLYNAVGTEWEESSTAVHSESADAYRFVADLEPTPAITVAASQDVVESEREGERHSSDDDDSLSGPGVATATVALLCTVLWIQRRRTEMKR
ncbi:hypothetical protein ACYJ1Y_02825 [Natrialbaceae archaeon A-gly3]